MSGPVRVRVARWRHKHRHRLAAERRIARLSSLAAVGRPPIHKCVEAYHGDGRLARVLIVKAGDPVRLPPGTHIQKGLIPDISMSLSEARSWRRMRQLIELHGRSKPPTRTGD